MKPRKSKPTKSADATTVVSSSLPPDFELHHVPAIPEAQFQWIMQSAKKKELTPIEFTKVLNDRQRATVKRKHAIVAGELAHATSASSREQAIVQMIIPYAESGVRATPGRKNGGKTTGEKKQQDGKATEAKVHRVATELLQTKAPHSISGIITQRLRLSRTTVLKHLYTHPSNHWKKG